MTLDELKKLSGIDKFNQSGPDSISMDARITKATENRIIEREQNIRPGTDAWFKLWFGRQGNDTNMPMGFRGRKK